MNRSHFQSKNPLAKALLAASVLIGSGALAHAQQIELALPGQPAPVVNPAPVGAPGLQPAQASGQLPSQGMPQTVHAPGPGPAAGSPPASASAPDQAQGQQAPATESYALPKGASLDDASNKLTKLSTEGAKSLQSLVGGALGDADTKATVNSMSKDKSDIITLQNKVELAKLAKELYKTVNGDEDKTKQELESVKSERDGLNLQIKALTEQLANANKQIQKSLSSEQNPSAVVASIIGVGGQLTAKVLVPGYGAATVKPGDVLANGQKVVSITPTSVTVAKDGHKEKLGFGTSVPNAR